MNQNLIFFLTLLSALGCGLIAGVFFRLIVSAPYLTMLVTIVFNVPRNDALAAVDPASANAASLWASYVTVWTAWNNVRSVAALAAAALLTIALCRG